MGGREFQEGGDICIPMVIHADVRQKPTHYKAIILQLKKYIFKEPDNRSTLKYQVKDIPSINITRPH